MMQNQDSLVTDLKQLRPNLQPETIICAWGKCPYNSDCLSWRVFHPSTARLCTAIPPQMLSFSSRHIQPHHLPVPQPQCSLVNSLQLVNTVWASESSRALSQTFNPSCLSFTSHLSLPSCVSTHKHYFYCTCSPFPPSSVVVPKIALKNPLIPVEPEQIPLDHLHLSQCFLQKTC